jgi:hypothetical protein
LDERIACGVHLCKHAFSERIEELGGILAESLTRPTAPISYGRIIEVGDRNVVRRCGGHFLDLGRLTQVCLYCYQRARGMPDQ